MDGKRMPGLSIVIPVFNEESALAALHQELVQACRGLAQDFEIIVVDDGSTDGTVRVLEGLAPLVLIRLRKNFGQTAGLDAGIRQARYDTIVTLDGDGQNDPRDIPDMLRHLKEKDLDAVSGWRVTRKDSWDKRIVSQGARWIRALLLKDGVHDSGCALKAYRGVCFDHLTLYGEMHRFIPALLRIKGFRVGELPVHHRPRRGGTTKYNWKRTVKGLIDMLAVWFSYKYAVRPLHLLGGGGLLCMGLGAALLLDTVYLFFKGANLSNTLEPLLAVSFLLAGIQLFVAGLIADILIKIYYANTPDVPYSIVSVTIREDAPHPGVDPSPAGDA